MNGVIVVARVIEFQGKTLKDGIWIVGSLHQENNLYNQQELRYSNCIYIERKINSDCTIKHLIIPETVGQYTGIIGKDKKKIYEHDMVENDFYTGEVYWNYVYNGWRVAAINENNSLFDTKLDNTYRVIGHKYDELIHSNYTNTGEI